VGALVTCSADRSSKFRQTDETKRVKKLNKHVQLTSDDVIAYFLQMLQEYFPTVLVGTILQAEFQVLLTYTVQPRPRIPLNRLAVNIHFTNQHWVTSWQDPCTRTIHIFDSLTSSTRLQEILPSLVLFYHIEQQMSIYEECTSQQTFPIVDSLLLLLHITVVSILTQNRPYFKKIF
jgi:hypothetical protein